MVDGVRLSQATMRAVFPGAPDTIPVGRSKSPGYGHLKLPHSIIAVSAAEQR